MKHEFKKIITVILKTSVQGTAVKSRETCDSVQGFQSFGLASLSVCCGSRKCKTCNHLVEGNTFTSNVTGRTYDVNSPGMCIN